MCSKRKLSNPGPRARLYPVSRSFRPISRKHDIYTSEFFYTIRWNFRMCLEAATYPHYDRICQFRKTAQIRFDNAPSSTASLLRIHNTLRFCAFM